MRTLERARRVAAETGGRLDRVLTQLGLISERGLAEALSLLVSAPLVAPGRLPRRSPVRRPAAAQIPAQGALVADRRERRAGGIGDGRPAERVHPQRGGDSAGRPVAVAVAVPIELEAAIDRLYSEPVEEGDGEALLGEVVADNEPAEEDAERLKDLASEAPVIRLVNQMIARAVETHASDVHLEPFPDRLRVRYRYDGVLHEVEPPPRAAQAAVISRVKIMARLDIAERRLPQDGRMKLTVRGHEIDFRVSTVPALRRKGGAARARSHRRRFRL